MKHAVTSKVDILSRGDKQLEISSIGVQMKVREVRIDGRSSPRPSLAGGQQFSSAKLRDSDTTTQPK